MKFILILIDIINVADTLRALVILVVCLSYLCLLNKREALLDNQILR